MSREEIIRIMLEINRPNQAVWSIDEEALEQWLPLLQAIAAAEREACAKIVEQYCGAWDDAGYALSQAIRSSGEEALPESEYSESPTPFVWRSPETIPLRTRCSIPIHRLDYLWGKAFEEDPLGETRYRFARLIEEWICHQNQLARAGGRK